MLRLPHLLRSCVHATGRLRPSVVPPIPLARRLAPSHCQLQRQLQATPASSTEKVTITFELPDGTQQKVAVKEGDNLLEAVLDNNVDIDGFRCV